MKTALFLSALLLPWSGADALAEPINAGGAKPGSIFLLRSTSKTPDAVAEAVKAYAEARHWQYLGSFKVKQGQVTLVKFCIPEVGKELWSAGLEVSAMLPCGNLGVYKKDGKTELSLLHPRYMRLLDPDPAVAKGSAVAEPLLLEMLDAVSR